MPPFFRLANCIAAAAALSVPTAFAADVNLVGLFPGRALVEIDRAPPRVIRVGESFGDIRLIETGSDTATFEIEGQRTRLRLGQSFAPAVQSKHPTAILQADDRGHFITLGQINGGSTRFVVDTGATVVALTAAEARRLGIDYRHGVRGMSSTANGPIAVWRVRLDSVRVGDINMHQVDAEVSEGPIMPYILLGMSFLNRTEMHRDGGRLTLTQQY